MKTINLLKLTSIALFMVFTFSACKKDKTTPKVSIDGKWVGTLVDAKTNPPGTLTFYFIIRTADKKVLYFDSDKFDTPIDNPASVDYTLTNNEIKFIPHINEDYSLIGKFDDVNGKLEGSVIMGETAVPGVSWSATKQK